MELHLSVYAIQDDHQNKEQGNHRQVAPQDPAVDCAKDWWEIHKGKGPIRMLDSLGDLLSSGLGVQGMLWATSPAANRDSQ